jgi:hypothetical protein
MFRKQHTDAIDSVLAKADLNYMRARLIESFAGSVLKHDLANALDNFCRAPYEKTARELLVVEPNLVAIFAGSLEDADFMRRHGMDPYRPRPNVAMLMEDPGFEALISAFVDDLTEYAKLEDGYIARGYSKETIRTSIAQYFEDKA